MNKRHRQSIAGCILILTFLCTTVTGQVAFGPDFDSFLFQNDLGATNTPITISTWFSYESAENNLVYMISGNSTFENTPYMFRYDVANGRLDYAYRDSADSSYNIERCNTNLTAGTLYHLAVTHDLNSASIYINGELAPSTTPFGSMSDPKINLSENIFIGAESATHAYGYDGKMTDLRLFSRALTSNDITDIYTRPWTLHDQWQDDSLVEDMSGNGNTATNDGAVLTKTADGWAAYFDNVLTGMVTSATNVFSQSEGVIYFDYSVQTNNGYLFTSTKDGVVYTFLYLRFENGRLYCRKRNGGAGTKNYVYYDGDATGTHKAALRSDGSSYYIYLDGVEVPLIVDTGINSGDWFDMFSAGGYMNIGGRESDPNNLVGTIYEAHCYGALTAADCSNLTSGVSITNAPLFKYTMQPMSRSGSLVLRSCINDRYNHSLIRDMSGNGNLATNIGGIFCESVNGWYAVFDEENTAYIDASKAVSALSDDDTGTILIDASYSTSNRNMLVTFGQSDANAQLYTEIYTKGGFIGGCRDASGWFWYTDSKDNNSSYPMYANAGERKKYAVSQDGSQVRFYMNGIEYNALLFSDTASAWLNDIAFDNIKIGVRDYNNAGNTYPFDGTMWNVSYFSSALTSNQIYEWAEENTFPTNEPIFSYNMQPPFLNTGDKLIGIARNYGSGPDGIYSNDPTAAPWTIQLIEPKRKTFYSEYNTNLVRDMSGNGNTSTNFGVELYQTSAGWIGEFGNGAYIKGGDYTTHTTVTICAKVKLDTYRAPTSQNPIFEWYADFNNRLELFYYNYGFHFQNKVGGSWNFTGGTMYCPDNGNVLTNWTVVCATHDGVEACLYVNGEIKTNSLCSIESVIDGTTYLGYFENQGTDWQGRISDALYFNRALTSNEVYSLWNNIRSFDSDTNLLIHYIMQPEFK